MMARHLLFELTSRHLKAAFGGVSVSWIWSILTPLFLLAVYSLVFGVIFKARVPDDIEVAFPAWLAIALWPWFAFSDGVLRGAQSIRHNAALIGKVSAPRYIFAASAQTAAFLMHVFGFVLVLVALFLFGVSIQPLGLPYLLLLIATLYIFSLALAFFFAALQVFVRDLEQVLPTLFLFWFFLTPILYAPQMLPPDFAAVLKFNPLTMWMEEVRAAVLAGKALPDSSFLILAGLSALALLLCRRIFERLSPHFEDFL